MSAARYTLLAALCLPLALAGCGESAPTDRGMEIIPEPQEVNVNVTVEVPEELSQALIALANRPVAAAPQPVQTAQPQQTDEAKMTVEPEPVEPEPAQPEPAQPEPAQPAQPAEEEPAQATVFEITPNMESTIIWTGYRPPMSAQQGGFAVFDGTVRLPEDGSIEGAEVEATVDMTSLFSNNKILTDVLEGEGFLNVEEYPTATFESTEISKADGENNYRVQGRFSLKDVTKTIAFPATIEKTDDGLAVSSEFTIDRMMFNVSAQDWHGKAADQVLQDDILINMELLAEPK